MVFSKHSTVFPSSLMTYPLDAIDEDSVGSTIPAFPRSKPSPVTDSPPTLATTFNRFPETSSPTTANWTTMTASLRTLPTGLRPHTTTVNDMLPSPSVRLVGTTPVVTILDQYVNSEDSSGFDAPTVYPSPTEPNYYVPLLDPPPPSTLAESITHHLLDSIIRDTMAQDPHPHNNNNNKPNTDPPPIVQYSTEAQSTTQHPPSSQTDTTMHTPDDNNDQPEPPSNNNTSDNNNDDRSNRNNNNEHPKKRTKTATEPNDDIQDFSLRIPAERNLTETVFKIIEQFFIKLDSNDTLQIIPTNNSTIPAPAPFDTITNFPTRAIDFSAFFHGITMSARNPRDRFDGVKVIVKIRCTIEARELKRRIFPHLQALDTRMDSKAIWSHGMAQIGWIHTGHTQFCYRNYYAEEIAAGFKRVFYDDYNASTSLEHDVVTEVHRNALQTACPTPPHIQVKPFTLHTEFQDNKIDAEVLAVFAPNPVKLEMRTAFSYLNPSLLGVEKCLISFDYERQVGSNKFAQMLIHNNEYHNQSTAIQLRNVHPDILNVAYNDPDYEGTDECWCLHQSLLENGVCSIETTKESETLGKYLVIVPVIQHDRILRRLTQIFDTGMHTIGEGDLNDKCIERYGNTPIVGTEHRLTDMDATRAATVLQCLTRTEQRHGLPNIGDITQACLNSNTAKNTTPRRSPRNTPRRSFAFSNISDVSCAHTAIQPTVGFPHQPRDSTAPAASSYSSIARAAPDAKSVNSAISSTASPSIHESQTVVTEISALSTVVTQMSAMINTMNESMRQDRLHQQQFQHNQQQLFVSLLNHLNVGPPQQPPSPNDTAQPDNSQSPSSDGMNQH